MGSFHMNYCVIFGPLRTVLLVGWVLIRGGHLVKAGHYVKFSLFSSSLFSINKQRRKNKTFKNINNKTESKLCIDVSVQY